LQIQAQTAPPGRQVSRDADMDVDTRMREMRGLSKPSDREGTPSKTKNTEAKLKIDKAELAKHALFLKTPQTGIFNLMPLVADCPQTVKSERESCENEKKSVEYFANSFSFREKKNSPLLRSDLSLAGNTFETGKSSVQSIIVELGDVPLEDLLLESDGVAYLAKYKPEQEAAKVNAQFEQIKNGIQDGKYSYAKSAPVKENTTYALRSIAYYGEGIAQIGKNADVLIVFRVVRRNGDDGTLTVLWKELDRKEAVKLKM
jgi:hypothetical protein